MISAAREHCLRALVDRLDKADITLDLIDFNAQASVADITLSEVNYIRNAVAAASDFIHALNEREVEGVIAEYLADAIDAAFSNFDWFTRRSLQRLRAPPARTREAAP
jgi:adenine C2-methylase RlmN of 23S rRNA A2503 and tRNA A37